jgi:hypothetical protein
MSEKITLLPTARDELLGQVSSMTRLYSALADEATAIAKARYDLFKAYRAAGFTEAQALELVKGSLFG